MEKRPRDHIRQLLEKRARRPMLAAAYAGTVPRMKQEELVSAFEWCSEHFTVIEHGEDDMPDLEWILDKAGAAVTK